MTGIRRKKTAGIVWLFALTYMISYVTRVNYGAVISEMVPATGYSRSLLAAALTGSFITYGLGQVVSGICGDRFSPKKLVLCGLMVTSLMNALIPLCADPYSMLAVWSVNGFAQAFLWPPMVRLMTALLTGEEYARAVVRVSWGSSVGTVLVYLLSPVMIAFGSWRGVFLASGVCGAAMALVWYRCCPDVAAAEKEKTSSGMGKERFFTPLLLGIMLAIVLQGMLRDGVTTWMPSYISETYGLSSEAGILTGVALPLFSILCFQAASVLYRKWIRNTVLCAGVIFGFGAAAALALSLFSNKGTILSVLLSALLTGAMHGVNLILISMVPPFFGRYGTVATVSGVLNACTYVGSAVSAYGIAVLSEHAGWDATLRLWFAIAAAGTVCCLLCVKSWNRRFPLESE